jgi:EAL domain-containing protein (putative c-di-GMP-specific phosphodiesterase class I)
MLVNERDRTLVRGVISLGKAFGRTVVAEGVETDEHAAALHDMGCDILQGYGIARPMPADDILSWVADWEMPESFIGHAIRDTFDDLVRRVRD